MRVEQLGEGEPDVAVVGSIHGDEPCGRDGIEAVLTDPPTVSRPVKFVVGNEAALAAGERYLDTDLNRAFPGDPESEAREDRLAAELAAELRGCTVLSLHSTQSYDGMFALVDDVTTLVRDICPKLSVDAVVKTKGVNEGRLFSVVPAAIEVECGYQGSPEAAANAEQVIREFLAATGVTDDPAPTRTESLPVFQLGDPIPKAAAEEYEVYARNFEELAAGEPIAAADGDQVLADEPFHPILLSAEGYEDVFGYTADHVGVLD
ncbi:succinylglutamate desuccinylase/aspartoacylase domain-containing protein [Haloarcula pellucida]|uniref:Succinylglutamate desuccinylase n=1 Tax=Haloarcula pellucida TaxID=1427151 RepID=A0A830GJA1_9EURY|nr:succinylglutamate desuccinylase/aspartoacylase family protein [Halomicroarcula pellucida]MBX0347706.1 succinylglutamate desuccinylase/aspartoacylase family protein [Halomicroarcula pellucida]GGN89946.1 succinylglutamate desuccinylase [Halomicroarcula pellucida]